MLMYIDFILIGLLPNLFFSWKLIDLKITFRFFIGSENSSVTSCKNSEFLKIYYSFKGRGLGLNVWTSVMAKINGLNF